MQEDKVSSQKTEAQASGWAVLLFLVGFIAWGWFYLFILRPQMNAWLSQYISGYPAMLHVFPIIGVPILAAMLVGGIAKLARK